MSEDADLKVVIGGAGQLSRAEIRCRLSALKTQVAATLSGIGLVEDKSKERAFNENRYFGSQWGYARCYESVAGLRPHLQIEVTARAPVLPTQVCRITTLADRLAGRGDQAFAAPVVAVAETVAEKALSFLRRYAQHRAGRMRQAWDTALVRHVYDVHRIHRQRPEVIAAARQAFPALVAGDQQELGTQFPDFAEAPREVLTGALRQARSDGKIQQEFTRNLLPLVYGADNPAFAQAFADFDAVAGALLDTLR